MHSVVFPPVHASSQASANQNRKSAPNIRPHASLRATTAPPHLLPEAQTAAPDPPSARRCGGAGTPPPPQRRPARARGSPAPVQGTQEQRLRTELHGHDQGLNHKPAPQQLIASRCSLNLPWRGCPRAWRPSWGRRLSGGPAGVPPPSPRAADGRSGTAAGGGEVKGLSMLADAGGSTFACAPAGRPASPAGTARARPRPSAAAPSRHARGPGVRSGRGRPLTRDRGTAATGRQGGSAAGFPLHARLTRPSAASPTSASLVPGSSPAAPGGRSTAARQPPGPRSAASSSARSEPS
jgi:hypothetical protein